MTSNRRGHTLIEMVIVAVLSALVLGTAVAATALVTGVSGIVSREVDYYHDLTRLATAFRQDAHQATEISAIASEVTIGDFSEGATISEMKLVDGRTVRYRVHNGLIREVLRDEKLVAREGFNLDRRQRVLVRTHEENPYTFVDLVVIGAPSFDKGDEAANQQRVWEVHSLLGRDRVVLK